MKVLSSIDKRCKACYFALKKGKLFIRCKENRKHKQRQG